MGGLDADRARRKSIVRLRRRWTVRLSRRALHRALLPRLVQGGAGGSAAASRLAASVVQPAGAFPFWRGIREELARDGDSRWFACVVDPKLDPAGGPAASAEWRAHVAYPIGDPSGHPCRVVRVRSALRVRNQRSGTSW